jgi:DNA-binding transcriptional LysR family regulator
MTLDELEAFVAIARLGGFTEASRRLHRSQPAISRRIRELEAAVGATLFERIGRGVVPTDAGHALLPHAEAALAAVRDGERAVHDRAGAGTALRLAVVGTLADSHIVDALREFRSRFERASVELRTATSREVSGLVRSGEADLGLRYFEDADPAVESVPLGTEKLYVVVPSGHPVTARRLRDLRRLRAETWLGFPPDRRRPDSFGHLLERELVAAGAEHPAITPVDSLTAQKRLVEAGLGIALMPESSVREEVRLGSLRLIDITGMHVGQPVVAIRRANGYRSPLATEFLAVLAEHTPELAG